MLPGSSWVLLLPLVGLLVELASLYLWWPPAFLLGLPLGQEPLPLHRLPEGEGQTAAVDWKVDVDGQRVLWRGGGVRREGLTALRGVVWLLPGRRGVQLRVIWVPPYSAGAAALALVWLGIARGTPALVLPSAALIIGGTALVYYQGAMRAAAELRYGLVRGLDEPPSDDDGE